VKLAGRESGGLPRGAALGILALGLGAWLWPIGLGGRMPVGGDVTQFSLGLMAFLARSLRAWRLPVWNHLWGYGFPGLAESQMGVYYPPHWFLYGLLPLEQAYTTSLVLHTFWGGLGTYWAARRFGVSEAGAALAGFAWGASGFYLIHLPHQWGYTVGSWMPWAWGLTWLLVRGDSPRRAAYLLTLVLVLQLLPGHFQLAFCTEAGVLLLAAGGLLRSDRAARRAGAVVLALAAVFPLAAVQLLPSFRLARLAESRRDYEYLSGFAATPLHLVSYVAPRLFRASPLWRPLAWDPFHTSPEEYLGYVGLVPLFLAAGAVWHGFRREPAVRALTLAALGTLIFSLGPYVPGFSVWSRLPGFSFFRAPARWSLATGLAVALLAGIGFDTWHAWRRPGRALAGFVGLAALGPALVLLAVELGLASTERPGLPAVAGAFERALNLLPWADVGPSGGSGSGRALARPREPTFRELMLTARQPQDDLRVQIALARQGEGWRQPGARTFARVRRSIYVQEMGATGVFLIVLLTAAPWAGRPRLFAGVLVVVTAADLLWLGHHRPFDLGPVRRLSAQSGVLARLGREGAAARTADPLQNMAMVAGVAPIAAYRTLDLPALTSLTRLAQSPVGLGGDSDAAIVSALRAAGASARVFEPIEARQTPAADARLPGWPARETIEDPALAGWLHGADWVAQQGPWAARFLVWHPGGSGTLAWLVPLTSTRTMEIVRSWSGDPRAVLEVLGRGRGLDVRRSRPERVEIAVEADGPAVLIVAQLADPAWRATWVGPDGPRPAAIVPAFALPRQGARPEEKGWQAVAVPGAGRWTLRLDYDDRAVAASLVVSGVSWLVWPLGFVFLFPGRAANQSQGGPT
jgi:hypothetical protein